jgi:hypothetical protein
MAESAASSLLRNPDEPASQQQQGPCMHGAWPCCSGHMETSSAIQDGTACPGWPTAALLRHILVMLPLSRATSTRAAKGVRQRSSMIAKLKGCD